MEPPNCSFIHVKHIIKKKFKYLEFVWELFFGSKISFSDLLKNKSFWEFILKKVFLNNFFLVIFICFLWTILKM